MVGFTVPSQLLGITFKADKSVSLRFATGELTSEEKVAISDHQLSQGWLLYSENPIQEEEIPKRMADTGGKTASQRLRGVMFLNWKQHGEKGVFQNYYNEKMEKLIDLYKEKLD